MNTATKITVEDNTVTAVRISAGGVGPVPLFLSATSAFLTGRSLSAELIQQANDVAQEEISPISDARGTAGYKRLLLRQLIRAHFITLFPESFGV